MTTLSELRTQARNLIGDTGSAVFTDSQIDQFINEAIKDISIHFPIRKTYAISTSANDRQYDLEADFISVVSVEYPSGEDPPRYLKRRSFTHLSFWQEDGYYDIIQRHSEDATNQPEIWISQKPGASETITVEYMGEHTLLSNPTDVTDVMSRHEPLIPLFARWRAWSELATSEGMNPDPIKLLSATQEVNARRAEQMYRNALREAEEAESATAVVPPWRMDKHDSIY